MITYITGNIFDDNAMAIVNTVNTQGVMGKGLALQFKEKYPQNYLLYKKACKEGNIGIGNLFITETITNGKKRFIINFPTKTTWRRPSEYSFIQEGLMDLRNKIRDLSITSIAIPPLGSHNGGLDWHRVKQMIIDTLHEANCDIRIYEPTEKIIERMKSERVKLTPARAMLLFMMEQVMTHGEFNSPLSAEKIVYFLKKESKGKEYANIEFIRGYYGPYSGGKVSHVLYYLNGSYIKGMHAMDAKPFDTIWLADGIGNEINDYINSDNLSNYRTIVEGASRLLDGFYSPFELELLSTVDMILSTTPTLTGWQDIADNTLSSLVAEEIVRWNPRKAKVYSDKYFISKAIERLRNHYYQDQPHDPT